MVTLCDISLFTSSNLSDNRHTNIQYVHKLTCSLKCSPLLTRNIVTLKRYEISYNNLSIESHDWNGVQQSHTELLHLLWNRVGNIEKGTAKLPMNNFIFIEIVSLISNRKRRRRKVKRETRDSDRSDLEPCPVEGER